jgi:hypothetical protein
MTSRSSRPLPLRRAKAPPGTHGICLFPPKRLSAILLSSPHGLALTKTTSTHSFPVQSFSQTSVPLLNPYREALFALETRYSSIDSCSADPQRLRLHDERLFTTERPCRDSQFPPALQTARRKTFAPAPNKFSSTDYHHPVTTKTESELAIVACYSSLYSCSIHSCTSGAVFDAGPAVVLAAIAF